MHKLKFVLRSLGMLLLLLVGFYACFNYLAEFSIKQSIALSIVCFLVYDSIRALRARNEIEGEFTPYMVDIRVNWFNLLSDYKLIHSEEQYKRLCVVLEAKPNSPISCGYWLTVIQPPSKNSGSFGLMYWNNHKSFQNQLDLTESICEVHNDYSYPQKQHPNLDHPVFSDLPRFNIRCTRSGFYFGLTVNLDWWELVTKANPGLKKPSDNHSHLCGTAAIFLGALPLAAFQEYYGSIDYGKLNKFLEAQSKELAATGWTIKRDTDSEIRDPWAHLEHRYFSVSHREI